LLANLLVVSHHDYATIAYLGFLGWCDTNRNISISVALPKVAKASTVVTAVSNIFGSVFVLNFYNENMAYWPSIHIVVKLSAIMLNVAAPNSSPKKVNVIKLFCHH
jgi:hypothetical protein